MALYVFFHDTESKQNMSKQEDNVDNVEVPNGLFLPPDTRDM